MSERHPETLLEGTLFGDTVAVADRTLADVLRDQWPARLEIAADDTELDDLRLVTEIGRGGMGVVYRAEQLSLNRPVAVKLLDPGGGWSADQLDRFQQEVLLAASLNHPNIAHVHWVRQQGALFYFVMELIDGPSLAELLGHRTPTLDDAVHILSQVCDGLAHAHAKNVVHRDLKPGNILLDAPDLEGSPPVDRLRGRAVLVDFGLAARHGESSTTPAGQLMGTPAYMSPEQARGEATDHRSDLYSLGVTLFETITGRVPFSAPTPLAMALKHLSDAPPDPRVHAPELPSALAELTLALLEKEPESRPASALEVRERLNCALTAPSGRPTARRRSPSGTPGLALRETTALAVTLDGFDAMAHDQAVARTTFVLESWMGLVTRAVETHGGQVVKQEAALLVALFTQRRADPEHALRAVRALRDLFGAVKAFNRTHGSQQAFTAGLEQGQAFAGQLGSDDRPVGFGAPLQTAVSLASVRHCGVGLVGPILSEALEGEIPLQPLIGVADELGSASRLDPKFFAGQG